MKNGKLYLLDVDEDGKPSIGAYLDSGPRIIPPATVEKIRAWAEGTHKRSLGTRALLTAKEVAEMLKVSKARVWGLARTGELPSIRLGQRQVRFSEETLREWIARNNSSQPVQRGGVNA